MSHADRERLDFALSLTAIADEFILRHYQVCEISLKADGSEVTEADRGTELALRQAIARRYPGEPVLGEEFGGEESADLDCQWVMDPVDGTTWFSFGMPLFGTLIAYLVKGDPVIGVIHFPALGETVFAGRGLGCWFRRRGQTTRVQVARGLPLDRALVSASGIHASDMAPGAGVDASRLRAVAARAGKFRFCGDCMQHALICRGTLHAAIDTIMRPWDTAALVPCVEEAGGVATTLRGERHNVVHGGSLVTSCDPDLHAELLQLLRS